MTDYRPRPILTADVRLTGDILQLTEHLAEHTHDVWAAPWPGAE